MSFQPVPHFAGAKPLSKEIEGRQTGIEPHTAASQRDLFTCVDKQLGAIQRNRGKIRSSLSTTDFLAELSRSQLLQRPQDFTRLLGVLGKRRLWKHAAVALSQMDALCGMQIDVIALGAAVNACAGAGEWAVVLTLLQHSGGWGISPDLRTLNCALRSVERDSWRRGLRFLEFQRRCDLQPDVITYNLLAAGCGHGQWRLVCRYLLDSFHGLVPDVLMLGAALVNFEKAQQWERALRAFKASHLRADTHILNSVASACAAGLQPKLAQSVVKEINKLIVEADVVTYGALVTAAEKGQLWQDSLDLLQHSAAKGIVPDLVLTGAVISASEKAGQWQSALGIAATMASYSLQPNEIVSTISFNAAAEACQKSLQWESAVEIMGMMTIDTIKPDIITMSLVSPPLELAGKAELLTSFLCSAEKLGFSKTPLDLPNELSARHMTATQLLADHDALSNRVERKFPRMEVPAAKARTLMFCRTQCKREELCQVV
ncbi:unnamed protein product [Durusdinium trenchii]|uniref:Pentatricopeptide repeat-containing protein, chloroplastic n=1 Tax=Durusdinium trenchii TaxID=1381693 RepID=A0ABP0MAB7_9DINO